MPSSSKGRSGYQSPPGSSPLSQSPQNTVTDYTIARQSRKKGRNTASKNIGASKPEQNTSDESPAPSPPQLAQNLLDTTEDDTELDRHHVGPGLLDAPDNLGGALEIEDTYGNGEWTKDVPVRSSPLAASPAREGRIGSTPASPRVAQGGFSSATPPMSPPQRKARPISYGSSSNVSRQPSEKNFRYGTSPTPFVQPPLPHHPQAHFFGAPDINLGLGNWDSPQLGGSMVHYKGFDYTPVLGSNGHIIFKPCLLIGSTGRLDVLSIEGEKLTQAGGLSSLSGDVIGASILPIPNDEDLYGFSPPYVVVIVHGPAVYDKDVEQEHGEASDDNEAVPANPPQSHYLVQNRRTDYQTRVEVFSLASQEYVATLYLGRPTPCLPGFRGMNATPPPPAGDLSVRAFGNHILLSSGLSGETFVFKVSNGSLKCLTKLWTTIQPQDMRKYSNSSASTESEVSPADHSRGQSSTPLPLFTMSGRWLAIVPPGSSSRPSINGTIPSYLVQGQVPGLDALHAPSRPPTTCIIDSPDVESIFNKVARGLAKEVVKGARWLGDQGLQTWNN